MVAVGDVRRNSRRTSSQTGRREGLLRAVHQASVSRPVDVSASRLVRVVERRRVDGLVAEVLHAGIYGLVRQSAEELSALERDSGYRAALRIARLDAAVGAERRAALQELADPDVLVVLLVVGVVAGRQREVHARSRAARLCDRARAREAVDLSNRGVDRERVERLLRTPRARRERVGGLDTRRRLLVGELEVA